jgi:Raf kinase inhibitor-like YbhB/YbcL family protein
MPLTIHSPAFAHGGEIPREYTCDGADRAPPLQWEDVPAGTVSFALIVDDPDAPDPKAPKVTWVHWVLYDLPAATASLPGAQAKDLPPGTREGTNSWKRTGWGGPCPPIGRHRYFHKLYALNTVLGDLRQPSADQLSAAFAGHVLGQAEIVGTYQRLSSRG